MNAKEFLGEDLYSIIEKLFIEARQSSKETKTIIANTLREDARNIDNKKVSLLFIGIADRIEKL